jgi:uncharacterized membrane protein
MSEVPVQLIVAAFEEEKAADEALKELKRAKWDGLIGIQDAAVLRRDQKNKLHVKETGDWGGGKGAVAGGALGATIGLILGPGALLTGAAGAIIGGLAAKLRDSGFSDERLATVGEGLQPGTSAIVAVIEHTWVDDLEKEMAEAGADVLTESISADIAEQLESGRQVAYTALKTTDAFEVTRVSAGEEDVEATNIVYTDEGVVATAVVATEDAVVAEQLVATEDGASLTIAAAVAEEDGEAVEGEVVEAEEEEKE